MKTPWQIIHEASQFNPVAIRVGFSGGRDSLAVTHWMMTNVPGCEVFHCNTGIGIEKTREYVRETCKQYGWPLHEIRAKEDCGQDYDGFCKRWGFPGPYGHFLMYARLKERPIRLLVKRAQKKRGDKVMLATGIRRDESARRMRYKDREVNHVGSQLWCNPIFHWTSAERDAYNSEHNLPINEISATLGMSGECLCGAFAHKGEKALIRCVDPATADRIEKLEREVAAAGFPWGWEEKPPKGQKKVLQLEDQFKQFRPLCVGCEKVHNP